MSQGTLISALAVGVGAAVGTQNQDLGILAGQLGMVGAGLFLASYSRDNERQADALAMEYMVRSGYHPQGAIGLMDMLRKTSKERPNALQLMFSTHPMSEERYNNLQDLAQSRYRGTPAKLINRERYLDQTARLRTIKGAILKMQNGETLMAQKKMGEAETEFRGAVKQAPNDYGGLVLLSRCLLIQKKVDESLTYAQKAKEVYPQEAQAYHLSGIARLQKKNFQGAFQDFSAFEKILPGNPRTVFFKGLSMEGQNKKKEAAGFYVDYLQEVDQGDEAQHAYKRLVEWGYIKTKK
jgi:predicted Zn-dependent protease